MIQQQPGPVLGDQPFMVGDLGPPWKTTSSLERSSTRTLRPIRRTDTEFARIEDEYGFEFADDHRAFLAAGLPLNIPAGKGQTWRKPWPDWRDGNPEAMHRQLDWPGEGALFDVTSNALWHTTWGPRPADPATALDIARRHLAQAPKMIPICGHRYLPAGRGTHGHPVLSIYQTDIIIYGTDLADYITNDFSGSGYSLSADWTPPPIGSAPP